MRQFIECHLDDFVCVLGKGRSSRWIVKDDQRARFWETDPLFVADELRSGNHNVRLLLHAQVARKPKIRSIVPRVVKIFSREAHAHVRVDG